MKAFRENAVILTGASRGIGREMAFQLADQGAWLALAAREAGALEEVAAECLRRGGQARAFRLPIPSGSVRQPRCPRLPHVSRSA